MLKLTSEMAYDFSRETNTMTPHAMPLKLKALYSTSKSFEKTKAFQLPFLLL